MVVLFRFGSSLRAECCSSFLTNVSVFDPRRVANALDGAKIYLRLAGPRLRFSGPRFTGLQAIAWLGPIFQPTKSRTQPRSYLRSILLLAGYPAMISGGPRKPQEVIRSPRRTQEIRRTPENSQESPVPGALRSQLAIFVCGRGRAQMGALLRRPWSRICREPAFGADRCRRVLQTSRSRPPRSGPGPTQ